MIPEDILHAAPSVLSHRISLTPEREMEGSTADDVLKEIIAQDRNTQVVVNIIRYIILSHSLMKKGYLRNLF